MVPSLDTTTDRIASSMTRPKVIIALMLVALASGAVFASVTLQKQDTDEIKAVQGTLNDSTNLSVQDINVSYTGFTADNVSVVIKNTGSVSHTVNVSVKVLNGSTQKATKSKDLVSIGSGNTDTVTVTLNEKIFNFDIVNVLVREIK